MRTTLQQGLTYQVDEWGTVSVVPSSSKKSDCYYTRLTRWAEREARERRNALFGIGWSGRFAVFCLDNDRGTMADAFDSWSTAKEFLQSCRNKVLIGVCVWFDAEKRPCPIIVLPNHEVIPMAANPVTGEPLPVAEIPNARAKLEAWRKGLVPTDDGANGG